MREITSASCSSVPGGGTALAKVAKKLHLASEKLSGDEKAGYDIVVRALEQPLRQIALNGGKDDVAQIVKEVQDGKAMTGVARIYSPSYSGG